MTDTSAAELADTELADLDTTELTDTTEELFSDADNAGADGTATFVPHPTVCLLSYDVTNSTVLVKCDRPPIYQWLISQQFQWDAQQQVWKLSNHIKWEEQQQTVQDLIKTLEDLQIEVLVNSDDFEQSKSTIARGPTSTRYGTRHSKSVWI